MRFHILLLLPIVWMVQLKQWEQFSVEQLFKGVGDVVQPENLVGPGIDAENLIWRQRNLLERPSQER